MRVCGIFGFGNVLKNIFMYMFVDQTLSSLDPTYAGKWRKYLNLKTSFYMAYVSTSVDSSHSF